MTEYILTKTPGKLEISTDNLTFVISATLVCHEWSPLRTNGSQDEREVVTFVKETTSREIPEKIRMHIRNKEMTSINECKDNYGSEGSKGKKVVSPKDPPSWIKNKIYNTRSKVVADRDQVSSGGLALDKLAKVILGRRSHIAIAKSQAEVDVRNGNQATIGRALRARKAQERVT